VIGQVPTGRGEGHPRKVLDRSTVGCLRAQGRSWAQIGERLGYLDEQALRYNLRKKPMEDASRFKHVASHILAKRLTYAELTGKVGTTDSLPN
jgi:hypothetical protein